MRVVVVSPPEPVISFEEAAEHLKLGGNQAERALVEGMIAAATATIDGPDGWLGRSLGAQTLEARFDYATGDRSTKHKGSVDYGSLAPSMAHDDSDAGQTLLRTAADDPTSTLYSFKAVYPTGEKRYFEGRVFGYPENVDGADSIIMATPTIEICKKIVKAPAEEPPPGAGEGVMDFSNADESGLLALILEDF